MDAPTLVFDRVMLAAVLSGFAGAPVAVSGGSFTATDSPYVDEQRLVSNAVQSRRAEFFSGRNYAREALRQLDYPDVPILRGDKGNPLWPEGVLGSITHDLGLVVVAVMVSGSVYGVGIDLVLDPNRVEQSLQPLIALTSELDALENEYGDVPALALAFSLKESVVKAISPNVHRYLDFMDIELSVANGKIMAHLAEFTLTLRCGFILLQNGLLSFAIITR